MDKRKYTIDSETGCWNFKGCKTPDGYGRMRVKGVHWMAHRYALSESLGRPIGDGMVVMHLCDNPSCVNPEHLKEGTQRENMEDCITKGRGGNRGSDGVRKPKVDPSLERVNKILKAKARGWSTKTIAEFFKWDIKFVREVVIMHQ
ncbi:hypothetical protein MA1A_gp20 [Pectobacterium phage MA1A]|nr:hypothetical protein MA6_gp01 [Pectobacterium phage MA6]QGH45316.1 hypothetical protein MA1A_gp20 [Pectobacterium phage MA1A]